MASRLWSHIDPDQDCPLLELPQMPQLNRYPRRTPSADPPTQGTEPVIEPAAPMSAMDLTDAGRAALQIDMQIFIQNEKRFREQDAAVQKLKDWVTDTVARHYLDVACPAEGTLAIWFKNLKQELGIDDERSKRKARQQYLAAIKSELRQVKEWERWLENWEKAISLAKEKKVPEALDTSGWVDDFLEAVRPIVGQWSSSYRMITKDTKLLTFRDLSNAFRDEVERLYPGGTGKVPKVSKGVFGPSFADQEDPDQGAAGDAQDEGAEEAEAQRKRRPSKRKKSKDETCAACGLKHSFSDCFYAFPEKAPDWFRPKSELAEKVKERFDTDQSLRKLHGEVLKKEREAKRQRKE